jgi:hypothetical protein
MPTDEMRIIPLRDENTLTKLLRDPVPEIAAALTGILAMGKSDLVLAVGRIGQAAIKCKALEQFSQELKLLIEKGRIKGDYAKSKFGFKSLVEIFEFIDSETPDEDRLRAVKAMFISINSVDAKEGEAILNYELLQISKRLSASQLFVLKAVYDLFKAKVAPERILDANHWLDLVARTLGHNATALVEQDESVLVSNGLVSGRTYADRSGIDQRNARLTDLGIVFCNRMVSYGGWQEQNLERPEGDR